MSALIAIGLIVATLVVFDLLASIFGVDSRYESQDPRSPMRGISI